MSERKTPSPAWRLHEAALVAVLTEAVLDWTGAIDLPWLPAATVCLVPALFVLYGLAEVLWVALTLLFHGKNATRYFAQHKRARQAFRDNR